MRYANNTFFRHAGKWNQQSRRLLAEAATADSTSATTTISAPPTDADNRVKAEVDDASSLGDDSTLIPVSPPPSFDDASNLANDPELPAPSHSPPARSKLKADRKLDASAIVSGKRRRKPRMSRECILEAMHEDDDLDAETVAKKAQFEKAVRERAEDADFRLDNHGVRPPAAELRDDDVLGKCCHCLEYLRYDQVSTHMADKHSEDILRQLHCPICNKAPTSMTLEEHLRVSISM